MSVLENQVYWLVGIVTQIPKQRNMVFRLVLVTKENQMTSGTKNAGLGASTKVTSRMVDISISVFSDDPSAWAIEGDREITSQSQDIESFPRCW